MRRWTDEQFAELSWHDNHVHGLRIEQGAHGAGELVLDIDHIVEWICRPDNGVRFLIVPATLTFHGVTNLRIALDWASANAALGPFSIDSIERRAEQRERYSAEMWTISVNWPPGDITFEASGFEQVARAPPVQCDGQCLSPLERGSMT